MAPPGFEWKIDDGLTTEEIEQAEGVVTAAFAASRTPERLCCITRQARAGA